MAVSQGARQAGRMKASDFGDERLLEVVFVDIGQGDGALIVTRSRSSSAET